MSLSKLDYEYKTWDAWMVDDVQNHSASQSLCSPHWEDFVLIFITVMSKLFISVRCVCYLTIQEKEQLMALMAAQIFFFFSRLKFQFFLGLGLSSRLHTCVRHDNATVCKHCNCSKRCKCLHLNTNVFPGVFVLVVQRHAENMFPCPLPLCEPPGRKSAGEV